MEFLEDKKMVVFFSKRMKLETVIHKLSALSSEQIVGFFENRGLRLPRRLHCLALVDTLNQSIPKLNSLSMSKDAFEKLAYYPNYTEFQLQNLFGKIGDLQDFIYYKESLWTIIIKNYSAINLTDGELQYLLTIKKLPMEDFATYSLNVSKICADLVDEYDGCPISKIEKNLMNSYTIEEIRLLAQKYDFTIPERLKKEELVSYTKEILKNKRKLTKTLEKEIDQMTLLQLSSFCSFHKILLSPNLKKEEAIYLFLFLMKKNSHPLLDVKKLYGLDEVVPLKFQVDLDAIQPFGKGEARKVIYLEGETIPKEKVALDPLAEMTVSDEELETDQTVLKDSEVPAEVSTEETPSSETEEAPVSSEEELISKETIEPDSSSKEPSMERTEPKEETPVEETVEEPAEETPVEEAVEEPAEETPVEETVEEPAKETPMEEEETSLENSLEESPYFKNKKMISKKKTILLSVLGIGGVIVVIALVWMVMKHFG